MTEGNGILSAIKLFDLGFLSVPVKNTGAEMRVVKGHRARELTSPFSLLDEFRNEYKQEPDAWAVVCGYRGLDGYLVYIDAEDSKIALKIREKIKKIYQDEYREEFGSKGAHFPFIITDEPIEKRTEFHSDKKMTSDNLVMEVLTDWLCVLPGSKHRKTGKEYATTHGGGIPKAKKAEFLKLLQEVVDENGLVYRQKKAAEPISQDQELMELKIKFTFFDLGLTAGLQSCPLPGHKNNDAHPSLSVSADGRVANCFSVHGGMDIFKFIMLRENIDFPKSIIYIRNRFNPQNNVGGPQVRAENARCAKIGKMPIFYDDVVQDVQNVQDVQDVHPFRGLHIRNLHKLLMEDIENSTKWLIPNLVPENSITMIAAKRGQLKTFLALHFAASAAMGEPSVLGKTEQTRVLYLDFENGEFEFRRRMVGILKGTPDGKKEVAGKNIDFMTYPALQLDDEIGTRNMIDVIKLSKAKIVFVDTQRRLSNGEENASETSNNILTGMQRAILETGCSFVLLHHMRKGAGKGQVVEDEMDEIRGSSDITASCSVIYSLKRVGHSDKFAFKQLKNRYAPERNPLQLHIEGQAPDEVRIISDGEMEDVAITENGLSNLIWEWLISERKFEFETSEINGQFVGAPPGRYGRRSVADAIAILVSNDKFERLSKGRYKMVLGKKQEKLLKEQGSLIDRGGAYDDAV